MFWKRKEKEKNSPPVIAPTKKPVLRPDLLERLPRSSPPPRPPVEYIPPPPPPDSPEEESPIGPVSEAEHTSPPSPEELAAWRCNGGVLVITGEIDEGVSLLLDVLRYIPDDPESLLFMRMVLSGEGKLHLSPMNLRRIEEFFPSQKVKAQIIVKR